MTAVSTPRSWTILRQRVAADVVGLPVVWGLFVVGVALLVGAVALLGSGQITSSALEQAAQLARWYVGAVGVYLTAVSLPLYLAHGYTRREFAAQVPVFVLAFSAAFAALMTVGFGLETVAYRALGWVQALTQDHLFASPTQYHLVLTEFLLIGVAWTVAGALLGAAFYRNGLLGLALVPVALALVGAVEAVAGPRYFGPIPLGGPGSLPLAGLGPDGGALGLAVLVTAVATVAGLALVWAIVRDLPIRAKAS